MHGGDRRLQRVRSEAPRQKRAFHERRALRNLRPVPERAILIRKEDEFSRRRGACDAPRLLQQHKREQADLRLRQQFDQQPRAYRLADKSKRVNDGPDDAEYPSLKTR